MAKKIYLGNSSVARYCPKCYIGVSNVARKVTKGYIGDSSNKARLCYIAAIGISSVTLNYPTLNVGATVTPTMTIAPTNYDPYTSRTFSITSGSGYATINSSTGALTGTAAGTVTVKVTIVDATGKTITATKNVTVNAVYTLTLKEYYSGNWFNNKYRYFTVNGTKYTSNTTLYVTSGTRVTITNKATDYDDEDGAWDNYIQTATNSTGPYTTVSYSNTYTYTVTKNTTMLGQIHATGGGDGDITVLILT